MPSRLHGSDNNWVNHMSSLTNLPRIPSDMLTKAHQSGRILTLLMPFIELQFYSHAILYLTDMPLYPSASISISGVLLGKASVLLNHISLNNMISLLVRDSGKSKHVESSWVENSWHVA